MSKPEHFDNEQEQGLRGTEEQKTNDGGSSRRRFIRNIAIGTGAAVAMSNLDRLRGASRLLERYTNTHVDGFLEQVRSAKRSPRAKQEFQRLTALVLEAVGNDPKSQSTFTAVKAYLSNPIVPLSANELAAAVDMVIGAGYLRAIAGLQASNRHVSAQNIKSRLGNPKAIFDAFESGFLNQLYVKTKAESASSSSFAMKLTDASTEAKGVATDLIKQAKNGKEPKLIPASFFQGCDCTINGNCATLEECIIAVAIIVVIILVVK
jgi:hypothetical protein